MIIVLNNKSNFKYDEFVSYYDDLSKLTTDSEIILCPSSCFLSYPFNDKVSIGAQDVSESEQLYITGNITCKQLSSLGIKYCIIGHSDINDSLSIIKEKLNNLLSNGIIPIICVSEINRDDSTLEKETIIIDNLKYLFNDEKIDNKIIIVYEPSWAVNNDYILDMKELSNIITKIKIEYPEFSVLYGGGVNKDNFEQLKFIDGLDGVLLGRFGNNVNNFKGLI